MNIQDGLDDRRERKSTTGTVNDNQTIPVTDVTD
jgi:hypothetical protein